MATPTRRDQQVVDFKSLEQFTQRLIDKGVHGLFPGSSVGEFPSFTTLQNQQIVETVAEAADGDATVLAGCSDTSVDAILDNIDAADAAGVDAGVVVSPYYLETTQSGLERFFGSIADESTLPLLLYNIPQLTGNRLTVKLVGSISNHDKIVGLKDTSGDLTYHRQIIEASPDDFAVFQGATELATASLDVGADGLIAGPANVFPNAMVTLYEAYKKGDLTTARRLMQDIVIPMVTMTSEIPTAAALKYLVGLSGLDIGKPLPPLPRLTDDQRATLSTGYQQMGDRTDDVTVEQ